MTSKILVAGLTATAAFLLATNPVVVDAAGQITGAQIKNSSLKGKDIKDGAITGADVNEATLAGVNATTLNALAPSAYQSTVIRVPVAATPSTASFIKPLPTTIPNGTYLVTININANLSGGGGFFCGLYPNPVAGNALVASFGSNYGTSGLSSINAAKVLTVTGPLSLFCASSVGDFSTPISSYNASEITFTKIVTETTTATVARGGEGGRRPGPAPRP